MKRDGQKFESRNNMLLMKWNILTSLSHFSLSEGSFSLFLSMHNNVIVPRCMVRLKYMYTCHSVDNTINLECRYRT
jgi:hypothetical protein